MAGSIKFKGGVAFSKNADSEQVVFEGDADGIIADKAEIAALTTVSAADAEAAVGANPTKAEYDVLVTLANANKVAINAIIAALKA